MQSRNARNWVEHVVLQCPGALLVAALLLHLRLFALVMSADVGWVSCRIAYKERDAVLSLLGACRGLDAGWLSSGAELLAHRDPPAFVPVHGLRKPYYVL